MVMIGITNVKAVHMYGSEAYHKIHATEDPNLSKYMYKKNSKDWWPATISSEALWERAH